MQIAITGVKNVADLEAEASSDLVNAPQRHGKFRPRDHPVLDVVARRDAPDRSEGVLASLPEQVAFLVIPRPADLARTVYLADLGNLLHLHFDRFAQPFDLDQQHRSALDWKAGVDVILDHA